MNQTTDTPTTPTTPTTTPTSRILAHLRSAQVYPIWWTLAQQALTRGAVALRDVERVSPELVPGILENLELSVPAEVFAAFLKVRVAITDRLVIP